MTHTLKNQAIFRPTSRPASPPSPLDSSVVTERAQPLTRVPFNLRRSSLTPATSPGPAPPIQDKSFLEALGLRLNEAVSKALAHPSGPSLPGELLGGRRPIPAGRGRALGGLIASYATIQFARLQPTHSSLVNYKRHVTTSTCIKLSCEHSTNLSLSS